jgi:N-acetyl-anhydromuramyl-L-alanine amidase AmpD
MPAAWNELVPEANRFESPNKNSRKPSSAIPTHIVVHVTGDDDLASVKRIFLSPKGVSAHYLVLKDGQLLQFVPDGLRAWHAGIDTGTRSLYRKGASTWMRYLKYFSWYRGYSSDAQYVDADLKPVWHKTEASFAARPDAQRWTQYDYFVSRWPERDAPVNFDSDPDPNNYSIGIETLGLGADSSDPGAYTPAMYSTLRTLVQDLSRKYSIPIEKGRVVGHEDVNPVARFGWDPSSGFDWSRILA